jgi:hypothetical protein
MSLLQPGLYGLHCLGGYHDWAGFGCRRSIQEHRQVCRVTADRIDFLPTGSLAPRPASNFDRNAGLLALCMINSRAWRNLVTGEGAVAHSGYQVGRMARQRGAWVIYGGIHATLFPEEALERGEAHAVVKGDGDIAWGKVVTDCLAGAPDRRMDADPRGRCLPSPAAWK